MANYTILLIDYEPRSIQRFRDPLTAAGYAVEIATDGVSGIEAFHRLNPDMVLVEAMIPKKHGFEVCQELKRTPHGRRTPVIITTGVYKGRKYRTQALHIYGCDEYIEKPIAAEQLLEVVGKFFVSGSPGSSGSSGSSSRGTESAPVSSEPGGSTLSRGTADAIAKPGPSAETRPIGIKRNKPTSGAPTLVQDDTEDEIMARLDEILPGARPTPASPEPERIEVVAAEPENPFAQMRAELDAELGSISGPLAFEIAPNLMPIPEPVPSDQAASPSVLEALPQPDASTAPTPVLETIPLAKEEPPGQVVSFDTKRSRKGRKSEKHGKGSASQNAKSSPSAKATLPPVIDPPIRVASMALPHGTMAESELESGTGRRGKSVVLWFAVAVVALAVAYLVFPRGDSRPSVSAPQETLTPTVAANVPAVASPPPAASAPAESIPKAPEPVPPAPEKPKPALGPVKPPVTKKPADRIPPTATTATASGARKTAGQAQTPTAQVAPRPKVKTAPAEPVAAASVAPDEVRTPPQEAPATPDVFPSATGVDTSAEPAPATPKSTVAPGTLIPIDEADTLPVPLSHRPPIYSMAARQLRISGTVIMNVLVNDRGNVDQVVLVTGVPGSDVNEAAIRAAKSWTYRPATKDGVPVKVWKSEKIVFKL